MTIGTRNPTGKTLLGYMLASIWATITVSCTGGGSIRDNVDGTRPRAVRSTTWSEAGFL
jgi:hypothetical protein